MGQEALERVGRSVDGGDHPGAPSAAGHTAPPAVRSLLLPGINIWPQNVASSHQKEGPSALMQCMHPAASSRTRFCPFLSFSPPGTLSRTDGSPPVTRHMLPLGFLAPLKGRFTHAPLQGSSPMPTGDGELAPCHPRRCCSPESGLSGLCHPCSPWLILTEFCVVPLGTR